MIDPHHPAAPATGFIGAAVSAMFAWLHEYDWAVLTGFATFLLVVLQVIGWFLDRFGPEKWKIWRRVK